MKSKNRDINLSRRDFLKTGLAAASYLALGNPGEAVTRVLGKGQTRQKVIILGCDGLDTHLFQVWLEAGKLPAFKRLISAGDFRSLGTSIPPQSPVAWSNFIAGTDPGGHGIFDFVHRDPKTYIPIFSASSTEAAKKTIRLGNLVLPLSSGKVLNLRQGRAFWQILEDYGIPATIFKIPSNYPPVPTKQRTLSGMGTPDIKGYYGLFNFYTTLPMSMGEEVGGGGRVHEVYVIGNRIDASLPGPDNTFKKDVPETSINFQVFVDPKNPVAKISIQGQEFILKEKEWSGWKRIHFNLIPTQSVSGICMFYLKEVHPNFKLYVSPIHIDPRSAALPISTPKSYAEELERVFGPFFTKGLPADTSALDNDALDDEEFLEQDDFVLHESIAMLDYELQRFESGLLFYYISSTDQRQHMFWRLLDENHPSYDPALASKFGKTIENIYIEADRILDRVMQKADKDTIILVMSDHGFNPFSRGFNLNTWLKETGYHKLINDWKQEESSLFANSDWSKTKAYGVGLNGLYINQRGREAEGIVSEGPEKDNLVHEIAQKLEAIVDPKTGERPVLRAFISKEVYRGPYVDQAPEIVLGFNRGYRISWVSPLGQFPKEIFADNTEKWSGDHMGAPEVIPGILAINRKVRMASPALYDLTATIFDIFGIEKPSGIVGRSIFKAGG
jgi:predicted AlkP superfamily phosphohydrolase/phosphomutase